MLSSSDIGFPLESPSFVVVTALSSASADTAIAGFMGNACAFLGLMEAGRPAGIELCFSLNSSLYVKASFQLPREDSIVARPTRDFNARHNITLVNSTAFRSLVLVRLGGPDHTLLAGSISCVQSHTTFQERPSIDVTLDLISV